MRLLTLLAGYAAGLAVAMKYKKNTPRSKAKADTGKSKMETFVDDVVDMHKAAFEDIKQNILSTWDDIDSFDELQTRVKSLVSDFGDTVTVELDELRKTGNKTKDELMAFADRAYAETEISLDAARIRAASFADTAAENIDVFLDDAKKKLASTHKKLKDKLEKDTL